MEKASTLDLNLVIDLTLIAHKSNMSSVSESGASYLLGRLAILPFPYRDVPSGPYTNIMFTEEQLKKVFPIVGRVGSRILNGSEQVNRSLQAVFSEPGLAKDFVHGRRQQVRDYFIMRCISHIELSGTGSDSDGRFMKTVAMEGSLSDTWFGGNGNWGGKNVRFTIQKNTKDDSDEEIGWAILRDDVDGEEHPKTCWWAPCSENLPVPPLAGWVPRDELATGNPTIKYILNESVG